MRGIVGAALAGILFAGSAFAASPMGQLKDIGGSVYVNRGQGFFPVQGSIELMQGDRVMINEDGSATLTYYLSGCEVMLTASSMTTIGAEAPCKGAGTSASTVGVAAAQGSSSSGISTGALVAGGVGVAGAAGLAVALSSSDDDDDDDDGQSP